MAIPLIPIAIGFALAALLPSTGCSDDNPLTGPELDPDKPLPFPDEGVDGLQDGGASLPPDMGADACVPDPCDGVVDPRVSREELGGDTLCFSFAEVQGETGLIGSGTYWRLRVADFDQDGWPDLHLSRHADPDQLFRNNGDSFENVASARGLALTGNSRDSAWKDADGDEDLDVFVAGEEGSDLYLQNVSGNFSPSNRMLNSEFATAATWLGTNILLGTENGIRYLRQGEENEFPASRDAAWDAGIIDPGEAYDFAVADYDGDANEDVYVANNPGQDRLYRNLGDGTYESVEESLGMGSLGNSIDAKWVRFQGEVLPSLYVSSWDGSNFQYVNNQDGTFTESSGEYGIRDPGPTTVSTWGDIVQNIATTNPSALRPAGYLGRDSQQNLLYIPVLEGDENRVVRYMETAFPLGMAMEATTMGAEWFDYNGDGLLDIAVVTYEGGLFLFENRTHFISTCPKEAIL